MEDQRPPRVRTDYRRRRRGSRIGALFGVIVGFGLVAAIAWAAFGVGVGSGGSSAASESDDRRGRHRAGEADPPHRLSGGVHAEGDGGPYRRGERDRAGRARDHDVSRPAAVPPGHGEREDAPGRVQERRPAEPRGLPLPGDLRLHRGHDLAAARRRPARGVRARVVGGGHGVRALEEADAVRRAHHRFDGREGGAGPARARHRRGGDLQPAPREHAARDRRDHPLRLRHPADAGDPAEPARRRPPVQLAHARRLPPTPISNPGLAALQAAAHPAEVDFLYFVRKADCKSHFFTASLAEFNEYTRAGTRC